MSDGPTVLLKRLDVNVPNMPMYETEGSAGADIRSSVDLLLPPLSIRLVPTGYAIAIEAGYEAQVRSRSGMALRYDVVVLNSPGTIDSDYRGELQVILKNNSNYAYEIEKGDRIAQLVVSRVPQAQFKIVDELPSTSRGESGFGSTGIR